MTLVRLVLGWLAAAAAWRALPLLPQPLPGGALLAVLAGVVVVIVICAFGVVEQAEHLAHRLGDPYGTLVLTLSIAAIEVILISSVMLGPGDHATIARDSVMAVAMIILGLVAGAALVTSAVRQPRARPNPAGVRSYLVVLAVLLAAGLALPRVVGAQGAFMPWQQGCVAGVTLAVYTVFLARQLGRRRADFQEIAPLPDARPGVLGDADPEPPTGTPEVGGWREHRREVLLRAAVLIGVALPIVLLSHEMAALLDDGLGRIGARAALSGLLVAVIVFLPETLTTLAAARAGELQRVSNLCHGALVSTVGLTIPAVLAIGLLTHQDVVLGASPVNLLLLVLAILLTAWSFRGTPVRVPDGVAHLTLFAAFLVTLLVG